MKFIEMYIEKSMAMVREMSVWDATVFKLSIFAAALFFAKVLPGIFLFFPWWVYFFVYAAGAIFLLSKVDWAKGKKKKKKKR